MRFEALKLSRNFVPWSVPKGLHNADWESYREMLRCRVSGTTTCLGFVGRSFFEHMAQDFWLVSSSRSLCNRHPGGYEPAAKENGHYFFLVKFLFFYWVTKLHSHIWNELGKYIVSFLKDLSFAYMQELVHSWSVRELLEESSNSRWIGASRSLVSGHTWFSFPLDTIPHGKTNKRSDG